ncbi:MAG: 4Fe-4S dicluster domain-containing protein [Smithellaceae bacterium]|nr:4Fe-4S dicluster domain-containing protein [Smithellaceae bacterium]
MLIDKEKCIGCDECHPYCPVGAIRAVAGEGRSEIDQVECVECGCCHERSGVCPVDAIYMPKLEWPRCLREYFSNPNVKHPSTTGHGRGTEEMKTNDVTGRFTHGVVGVGIEMGRPGVGTSVRDMETVAMAIARLGVEFESQNPVAELIADTKTGKFDERVLNERFLSAILELKIPLAKLRDVLDAIREVAGKIDTAFSLDLISRVQPDGSTPALAIAREAGFAPRPNAKTNVGLGRPLFEEA